MTLEAIEDLLPNGLHDARIAAIAVDYIAARLEMKVEILVELPDDPPMERDGYRLGKLTFLQLKFASIEPPEPNSAFRHPSCLWFSYTRTSEAERSTDLFKALPPETLAYTLYIFDWYSNMEIAASDIEFSWDSDPL